MKFDAVIGNAYGDCGKGLMVDYLSTEETAVIRYCGGAQAGHTVVTPGEPATNDDGTLKDAVKNGTSLRHTFHHIGSGTFRGARTYLSRFFACDPVLFNKERAELVALRTELPEAFPEPTVFVDYLAPVVTPFDVFLNQTKEKARKWDQRNRAHGSCGCGIGEAFAREETSPAKLYVVDLLAPEHVVQAKLDAIQKHVQIVFEEDPLLFKTYTDMRPKEWDETCDRLRHLFLSAMPSFLQNTLRTSTREFFSTGDHFLFEGAQGLLLDRDIGAFPYVTRAKTGLVNIDRILNEAKLDKLHEMTVHFVSRCYMTRHGAGPLAGELPEFPGNKDAIKDEVNTLNAWQGALRYAPYDANLLDWARTRALAEVGDVGEVKLVITCLDHIGGKDQTLNLGGGVSVTASKNVIEHSNEEAPGVPDMDGNNRTKESFYFGVDYVSNGPTRNDVEEL